MTQQIRWLLRLASAATFVLFLSWAFKPMAAEPPATEFVRPGMHRVTVTVVDADGGDPLAARVAFTDVRGEYYPPLGHPRKIPPRPYGGDLALPNGKSYAYVDGEFQIELPAGEISVEALRGFEYDVHRSHLDASSSAGGGFTITLKRWVNLEEQGWYPGDTHFHFPNPVAAMTEMKAEGLRVANLLALKSGVGDGERPGEGTFWNVEHFRGRLSPLSDGRHLLYTNEEFRNHFLGHLIFLNLKKLVWPMSTGELFENGWGGYDLPTHADAAESARQQGGLVLWAHFPYPNGECPVDVALGKIDGFDILTTGDPFELHPTLQRIYKMYGSKAYEKAPLDLYYAYLNCGFRVTATAGSDKMSTTVPLGSARVYVKTGPRLDYQSWIDGIRQGHTFVSTGPVIDIAVDGKGPGEEISVGASALPGGSFTAKVQASCRSRMPYTKLEVVQNGRVVATAQPEGEHYAAELSVTAELERSGWLAARCYGKEMLPYGGPPGHWFRQPVFAHTNPVWVTIEGRPTDPGDAPALFLDQIEDLKKHVLHQGRYGSEAGRQHALDQIEQAAEVYRRLGGG